MESHCLLGSYPTYEEWKLYLRNIKFSPVTSSYPTYEEWKLLWSNELNNSFFGSYPTYEEWKQWKERRSFAPCASVLILPMRNGNYVTCKHRYFLNQVLILPMRNGNQFPWFPYQTPPFSSYPTYEEWKRNIFHQHCSFCLFLSYLWGMETSGRKYSHY